MTTQTLPANVPPSLTFPRATFAKLSPRPFLLAHLQPSGPTSTSTTTTRPVIRPNGRRVDEFRAPAVHTGSLSHADGSAVVRTGDTAVVCGVRAEILRATDVPGYADGRRSSSDPAPRVPPPPQHRRDDIQDLGLLVPNVELSTGCSPAHLPGPPPSDLAQSLAVRILSLLHCAKLVQDDDLRIWYRPEADGGGGDDDRPDEIKAFWTLYIDVLFISLDGNPFDAAWPAVLAALSDVRLPDARWDPDRDTILCDDRLDRTKPLTLPTLPIPSTFAIFTTPVPGQNPPPPPSSSTSSPSPPKSSSWILADPAAFEEDLCHESLTITLDCSSTSTSTSSSAIRILKIEKAGGAQVAPEHMPHLLQLARERWLQWNLALRGR